jgi:glucose-6-phosphate isomerase
LEGYKAVTEKNNQALHDKTGKGNDFLGWVNLPSSITEGELADIESTAARLKAKKIDVLVVIGIGGSYLGAKAVIDALSDSFAAMKPSANPLVVFAGQNISEDYLYELTGAFKGQRLCFGCNFQIRYHHRTGNCIQVAEKGY